MKQNESLFLKRKYFFLILFSLLITIIIFEAGLQIGHLIITEQTARYGITDPNAPIILCVGDSHTYGLGVDIEESYPARLEAQLRKKGYRVNIVNMGFPSSNTSEIRRRLKKWLPQYQPIAVIFLASVNNGWNISDTGWSDLMDDIEVSRWKKMGIFFQDTFRIIRGLRILLQRWNTKFSTSTTYTRYGSKIIHIKDEAWKKKSFPDNIKKSERTWRDINAITTMIKNVNSIPILMTYVAPTNRHFKSSNLRLRAIAKNMGVTLADNDKALRPYFTSSDGSINKEKYDMIFMPDLHLTALGYTIITQNILKTLNEAKVIELLQKQ